MEKYGLNIELLDFTQKQFETYQPLVIKVSKDAYIDFGGGTGISANSVVLGGVVRAAITAGFLTGVTAEQVDGLKPHVVKWLADEVRRHVKEIVAGPVDPN